MQLAGDVGGIITGSGLQLPDTKLQFSAELLITVIRPFIRPSVLRPHALLERFLGFGADMLHIDASYREFPMATASRKEIIWYHL